MKIGSRIMSLSLSLGLSLSAMPGPAQRLQNQSADEPRTTVRPADPSDPPKLLSGVDAVYPPGAKAARVEASIILRIIINEKGSVWLAEVAGLRQQLASLSEKGEVWSADVVKAHTALYEAALNAVMGRRYAPTIVDGQAVAVRMIETIDFRLDDRSSQAGPQMREPIRVEGAAMESKLLTKVEPVYSEQAKRVQISGATRLEVLVNERGEVARVWVISSGFPLSQQPAFDAVRRWRYSPTYVDGAAVPVLTTVAIPFAFPSAPAAATPAADAPPLPEPRPPESLRRAPSAKPAYRVEPEYPPQAVPLRISSTVILQVIVDEKGKVYEVTFLRGHHLFQQTSLNAVAQWRFRPLLSDGQPVPFVTTLSLAFSAPR